MSSKDVASVLARGKRDPRASNWLGFAKAYEEIKDGLNIHRDAAEMVLCGLCAVGDVRMQNAQRVVIEPGTCALGELRQGINGPAFVSTDDLRAWLIDKSSYPQRNALKVAIARRISDGEVPGDTIGWDRFCGDIRDDCNGWVKTGGKRKPARGFGDKTIKRAVAELRDI